MTQQTISPLTEAQEHIARPVQQYYSSKKGIISLLVLIGLLFLLFTGLWIRNLSHATLHGTKHRVATEVQDVDATYPLAVPSKGVLPPLYISTGHVVVYEQSSGISLFPITDGSPQQLVTPGYSYNQAVPAILTPSHQLLYSGTTGLWLMDIFAGTARQIASIPEDQVITSMVLSRDGTTIAWSTEPINGHGDVAIYAGPLEQSLLVYEHAASDCPCFRVFSFMNEIGNTTMLLLTDDRGDYRAVRHGLWTFDLAHASSMDPQIVIDEDGQEGPLAAVGNILLYSSYEGIVPVPDDKSVPDDIATVAYANSLAIATFSGDTPILSRSQVVLSEQHNLSNSADYHWVTTPIFSPDGHTLLYIEFASDAQPPFDRHSALYTVQINSSGNHLLVGKPQLLATSTALFIELGTWIDHQTLTFYADNALYALDSHTGAIATLGVTTKVYTRIIAVMGQN